jgi:hypothetical protein
MKISGYGIVLTSLLLSSGGAMAYADCSPHCSFTHFYGPSDYSYEQPGLFGYPRCGAEGYCSPHLDYRYSGVTAPSQRILVQPRAVSNPGSARVRSRVRAR